MKKFTFREFIIKQNLIDIPRPDEKTLDNWINNHERCAGEKVSKELMLQAYYFDCAFVIGRFRKDTQTTIESIYLDSDGSFSQALSTSTREGLSDALSYLRYCIQSPRYGSHERFKQEHTSRKKDFAELSKACM